MRIHAELDDGGVYELVAADGPAGPPVALFCENETNTARIFGHASSTPFPKDGINDHVIGGAATVGVDGVGTKAAWWYRMTVDAGEEVELRLRLRPAEPAGADEHGPSSRTSKRGRTVNAKLGSWFFKVMAERELEADEFYAALMPETMGVS